MDVSSSPRPRRAERESVAAARFGRRAVEPIAGDIVGWHDRAARLWAKFNHLDARHKPTGELQPLVESLLAEVTERADAWQTSLDGQDRSGRVLDAKKSLAIVIENLTQLRERLDPSRNAAPSPTETPQRPATH